MTCLMNLFILSWGVRTIYEKLIGGGGGMGQKQTPFAKIVDTVSNQNPPDEIVLSINVSLLIQFIQS